MKCPFCENEMQIGLITGDGRTKVHWTPEGEKLSLIDNIVGKGRIDADYTLSQFKIKANYCTKCKKMIFDTDISN